MEFKFKIQGRKFKTNSKFETIGGTDHTYKERLLTF